MHLDFSGTPEIAASREQVWRHLLDPHFIAAAMPGVESVEVVDPTHFRVVSAFGVGPLKLRFALAIELHDLVEPVSARMRTHGTASGSSVDMRSSIRLEEDGPRRVRLHWEATSEVSGTVTGLGRGLVEGAARRLTESFWQDFARRAGRAA